MAKKLYNARLAWEESMPPLAEAFADFQGFAKGERRVNRLYDLLAVLIQRHRRLVARRFYPTRELAEFFGVSGFTIATVFRRLQREGFLTLVRSSQTMIPARIPRTRITVRGLVAMPIWMPAFLRFADWREWFAIVQEELARLRFAAEPVFFKAEEDTKSISFVDRVLKFNPDYILWFCPASTDLNALRGFTDAGVPVLTVNRSQDHFPARVYPLSIDDALKQGLKEWWKSGEIDEVIVWLGPPPMTESLKIALRNCRLPHRVESFAEHQFEIPEYLERLAVEPRKGVIFDDELLYASLCVSDPAAMVKLFRHQRAMVTRHVLIPGQQTEGIKVDVMAYAYERLARRIAGDLSEAKGGVASRQATFQAEWRPQVALAEVSQYQPT